MQELIKNTYELANQVVPVVSRRKYETDPYGFTIKDIVTDSEKMLEHQMYNIEQTLRLDSDWVPFLEPWHGVGIYADAFGSETSWPEDDYPWTEPCIEDISQVYKLKPAGAGESPLMGKVLKTIEYFKANSGGRIPIALTDTQSPMNTASLIVRTEELLMSCYTHPEAVHHLLDLITDLIIDFSKIQLEQIGENKAIPGHLFPAGGSRGISVSDDNCSMVSPDIYRRFLSPISAESPERSEASIFIPAVTFPRTSTPCWRSRVCWASTCTSDQGTWIPVQQKRNWAGNVSSGPM